MKFWHEDNGEILSNPGMGWVIHHSIEKDYKDANEPSIYDKLDNVALLSYWAALEPEEGKFYWDDLDASVEKWTKRGKKLQFRISTDPMLYKNRSEGAPDWLYQKHNVPFYLDKTLQPAAKYPDYLNPIYQDKLRRFLYALSERYGSLDQLETVDLRGYGAWGEWHSGYPYDSYAKRNLALRSIIDTWYDAFGSKKTLVLSCSYEWRQDFTPPLHAPKSYEEFLYWSAFDYALSKDNISFRRDGIGGAVKLWDTLLMRNFYESKKCKPLICEYFDGYNSKINGSRGYFVDDSVEEALMLHPNYMMLMWDSIDFYTRRPDLIDHGLKRMGYRLLPICVETNPEASKGTILTLKHTWTNLAAGRFCDNAILKIRLVNLDTGANTITEETMFQPKIINEKELYSCYSNLPIPEGFDAGPCQIEFQIFNSRRSTPICLPLTGTEDSFYPVANMAVL
jgi:hypothetical protein